jgi:hypothetical protein
MMINKEKIALDFVAAANAVEEYIKSLTNEQLFFSINNKWNALEHLEHLNNSIRPLTQALKLPSFLLGWYFGKSNRPTRTYEQVVEKYVQKLSSANPAVNPFGPQPNKVLQKNELLLKFNKYNTLYAKQLKKCSEKKLITYILPHPLLGKITLAEMAHFTTYHNLHHLQLIKKQING